jgi:hypothetical protein
LKTIVVKKSLKIPGVDFTKSRKSKINRKCYRKCDFQTFDWLKFTLTTDLRLTTFCEIDHRSRRIYDGQTIQLIVNISCVSTICWPLLT